MSATSSETIIDVRGQKLRIAIDGRDGAPWLVFSNSLATDLSLWNAQVDALAPDWRILRYDFRGHGRSGPSIDPLCSIAMLANDLITALDAARANRVHHIGVSMGAVAGVAAAMQAPERFASLVVCNSRLRTSEASVADLGRRGDRAVRQGMGALVEPTLQKWFGTARRPFDRVTREHVAGMIASTDAMSFAAYAKGLGAYDLEHCMTELALPIHFLAGSDDGTIAHDLQALSAKRTDVRCALIDGAGHLPNLQAPAEFNTKLMALLTAD